MTNKNRPLKTNIFLAILVIVVIIVVLLFKRSFSFNNNVIDYSVQRIPVSIPTQTLLTESDVKKNGNELIVIPWNARLNIPSRMIVSFGQETLSLSKETSMNLSTVKLNLTDPSTGFNMIQLSLSSVPSSYNSFDQLKTNVDLAKKFYGRNTYLCSKQVSTIEGTLEYICYLQNGTEGYFQINVSVRNTKTYTDIVNNILQSIKI